MIQACCWEFEILQEAAGMILEGIVTSQNELGELNIAPMGPQVDQGMTQLVLRPFQTSRTFSNLKETRCGIFHVVDDVLLLAKTAIGTLQEIPETFPAEKVSGRVLASACRCRPTATRDTTAPASCPALRRATIDLPAPSPSARRCRRRRRRPS